MVDLISRIKKFYSSTMAGWKLTLILVLCIQTSISTAFLETNLEASGFAGQAGNESTSTSELKHKIPEVTRILGEEVQPTSLKARPGYEEVSLCWGVMRFLATFLATLAGHYLWGLLVFAFQVFTLLLGREPTPWDLLLHLLDHSWSDLTLERRYRY